MHSYSSIMYLLIHRIRTFSRLLRLLNVIHYYRLYDLDNSIVSLLSSSAGKYELNWCAAYTI